MGLRTSSVVSSWKWKMCEFLWQILSTPINTTPTTNKQYTDGGVAQPGASVIGRELPSTKLLWQQLQSFPGLVLQ